MIRLAEQSSPSYMFHVIAQNQEEKSLSLYRLRSHAI